MIETFSPDIFFVDRLMPGMDGATLASELPTDHTLIRNWAHQRTKITHY